MCKCVYECSNNTKKKEKKILFYVRKFNLTLQTKKRWRRWRRWRWKKTTSHFLYIFISLITNVFASGFKKKIAQKLCWSVPYLMFRVFSSFVFTLRRSCFYCFLWAHGTSKKTTFNQNNDKIVCDNLHRMNDYSKHSQKQ